MKSGEWGERGGESGEGSGEVGVKSGGRSLTRIRTIPSPHPMLARLAPYIIRKSDRPRALRLPGSKNLAIPSRHPALARLALHKPRKRPPIPFGRPTGEGLHAYQPQEKLASSIALLCDNFASQKKALKVPALCYFFSLA